VRYRRKKFTFAISSPDEFLFIQINVIISLVVCIQDTRKQIWKVNTKTDMHLAYLFTILAISLLSSVVVCENCGYVRGPLAATNDTVVIELDCSQSTSLSQYVPLQFHDDTTHVAVQLVHCHTVPVGLFTNVTDSLTSVTFASEDAVQLLDGTFEGLELVSELRLLGFTRLKNLSRSMLGPLRNIQTLIIDGFGRDSIELSHLGSIVQKLSGTPIRRVVLNRIKDSLFDLPPIIKADDFRISNASVKELIITNAPLNCVGSIRLAFPGLVCFYTEKGNSRRAATLPPIWDLMLLSDELKELVMYRPPEVQHRLGLFNVPLKQLLPAVMKTAKLFYRYRELYDYIYGRKFLYAAKDCEFGFTVKLGANLMKITVNGLTLFMKAKKPLCLQEDNNLIYMDFTRSQLPVTPTVITGLKKLKYLSLDNTGIKNLPNTFLQYYPALKVLKLSKVDIGNFIENIDGSFFGSCPTLEDIYLDYDNLTKIPTTIFSRSVNLQRLSMSKNHLRYFDFDLQHCTRLNILNLSHNSIESITQQRIRELTELAAGKTEGNNLVVDLSYNRLHCLCNSTHLIKWLQRSPADASITFRDFNIYTCLYPNGSTVRVSEVIVSEVEQQCSVIKTLVNDSGCPCHEEGRRRLQQVWVHLEGFFCKNDAGVSAAMKHWPLPTCFNPYTRPSFIAPVVVGGILGIAVFIAVGLLIYYRNTRHVRQVRECLEMNPVRFVRAALQYAMMQNHEEEHAAFRYDMIIFVQDDDRSSIHSHFIESLQGKRYFITRDDFLPGVANVEAMAECIRACKWIVPVLTAKFLSDPACIDFVNRVQFSRPHALIPIVWEKPIEPTDVSVVELLQTGNPLCWSEYEDKCNFWASLLDRTT